MKLLPESSGNDGSDICRAFAVGGAAICGMAAAAGTAIFLASSETGRTFLEASTASLGFIGLMSGGLGAINDSLNGKWDYHEIGKKAGTYAAICATGSVGGAGIIGGGVGAIVGAAIGYPVQAIYDCLRPKPLTSPELLRDSGPGF